MIFMNIILLLYYNNIQPLSDLLLSVCKISLNHKNMCIYINIYIRSCTIFLFFFYIRVWLCKYFFIVQFLSICLGCTWVSQPPQCSIFYCVCYMINWYNATVHPISGIAFGILQMSNKYNIVPRIVPLPIW